MMSRGGIDAESKFWRTPELVESLLPFLDARSVLSLAKSHKLTLEIIQRPVAWNKLMRRYIYDIGPLDDPEAEEVNTEQARSFGTDFLSGGDFKHV